MALALKYMAVYSSMTFGSESIGKTKDAISKILRNFSRNFSRAGGRWTQAVNKSCKSVYLMPKSIHTSMYLKKVFYRILPVHFKPSNEKQYLGNVHKWCPTLFGHFWPNYHVRRFLPCPMFGDFFGPPTLKSDVMFPKGTSSLNFRGEGGLKWSE